MVAGSDDYPHCGVAVVQLDKKIVEGMFGGCTWLLDIEDIATHQQCVRLILSAPAVELVEEMLMFIFSTIVLVHYLS